MAKVEVVVTDKNGDIVAKTTHDSVASAQGLPIHYSETDKVNIRVSTQFVDNYIFGDFK
jgi:hypothetical protein